MFGFGKARESGEGDRQEPSAPVVYAPRGG